MIDWIRHSKFKWKANNTKHITKLPGISPKKNPQNPPRPPTHKLNTNPTTNIKKIKESSTYHQKWAKVTKIASKNPSKTTKVVPKGSKWRPKHPPGPPRRDPRAPKRSKVSPRRRKRRAKWAQDVPKGGQRAPKKTPKWSPRGAQGPSKKVMLENVTKHHYLQCFVIANVAIYHYLQCFEASGTAHFSRF